MTRRSNLLLPLAFAFAMAVATPVLAQSRETADGDPFAEVRAGLDRTVDFHLEQASKVERLAIMKAAPAPQRSLTAANVFAAEQAFANARLERVALAQARLRALGVDAARIFNEEGVPLELMLIAEVESNYDVLALSPKRARGLWQLMPETAARFGLEVNERIDERTHPARATRAAARYLRQLHIQFGDWLLALAAYNAGEARVAAAIKRVGTRNFWQPALQDQLPQETRRYVPAVLAAMQRP